jgi:hypothetical protein
MQRTLIAIIGAMLLVGLTPLSSQLGAGGHPPVATVSIELKAAALGVGMSWGEGVLRFQGKTYPFRVKGLQVGDVGFASISAVGNVHRLHRVKDFPGTYASAGAGLALGGGVGGLTMRNNRGVIINLYAIEKGVQLTVGAQGFTIEWK